jgi:hypothetical protein
MIARKGGVLPLGDGRTGVPIEGNPSADWIRAFGLAMSEQRPGDERWAHAANTITVDNANGVRHIAFITSGVDAADFVMTYLSVIDAAIEAANTSSGG